MAAPTQDHGDFPRVRRHATNQSSRPPLREAREETGLQVRLIEPLSSIEYWFVFRTTRYHKTVHFYLMEATGGDVAQHDHEYDEVRWFDADEALTRLTYPNEVEIARRAVQALGSRAVGE